MDRKFRKEDRSELELFALVRKMTRPLSTQRQRYKS
jgi:hypothetical protein